MPNTNPSVAPREEKKAVHTPGPWMLRGAHQTGVEVEDSRGLLVAGLPHEAFVPGGDSIDPDPSNSHVAMPFEANARLIAAAPDLLEAAEKAEALLASIETLPSHLAPFQDDALRKLRTALKKVVAE